MSTYIPLGKIPSSPEERRNLIGKRVAADDHLEALDLTDIQKQVVDFLISEKDYLPDDIETNKTFTVSIDESSTPGPSFNVKADIVLNLDGKRLFIIKCVLNSLESWERHSAAFCRIVDSYQIPFAVITDGESARLIDAVKGKFISEGLASIPSRSEVQEILKNTVLCPYPEERSEKEKRILFAFDAITPCPPKPA